MRQQPPPHPPTCPASKRGYDGPARADPGDIRSYLDTARKHGLNAMDVLRGLMLGSPGGRRKTLKIAEGWPWTSAITTAWQRIQSLPQLEDA